MEKPTAAEEKVNPNIEFLEKQEHRVIKSTKKRWLILIIFIYYACMNAFQWIEYCSITPFVVKYYNVSTTSVDWTSIIFMALYPFLVVPASYIIDKKGLRIAAITGCVGTLTGTSIKVLSIRSDLFFIVMIGQTIVSASQIVIISLPPKIASVWFKSSELSTVCSLGVFGTQLGCALGFLLPPIIVKDSSSVEAIGSGLKLMTWSLTIAMLPITLAVLLFFRKEPQYPPSLTQAYIRETQVEFEAKAFFASIKGLFRNKGFTIHMMGYGINVAVFTAISTLLTQFVLQYFESASEDAGRMGCILIIAGMFGSVILGVILDRTHKYKESAVFVYAASAMSVSALILSLHWRSLICSYVSCAILGVFTTAYMLVGFEFGIELTFPIDESTSSGILFSFSQVLGFLFTLFLSYFNSAFGCFWSLITQVVVLVLGTVITLFVPNKMNRQEALKNGMVDPVRKESYPSSKLRFIE